MDFWKREGEEKQKREAEVEAYAPFDSGKQLVLTYIFSTENVSSRMLVGSRVHVNLGIDSPFTSSTNRVSEGITHPDRQPFTFILFH